MNEKIAFIICVNNELYYEECIWYLGRLIVPKGYEIDVFPVRGASSMTEGYSIGMEVSDAKYKIYMHQDVFIFDTHFLFKLLECFKSNEKIGLVGVIGSDALSPDAIMWNKWKIGRSMVCGVVKTFEIVGRIVPPFVDSAKAIDGMIMATQYDIPWRTDLDLGWDFYDVSCSLEYLKKDFSIAILAGGESSMLHDCGCSKLANYDFVRTKIMSEYSDFFYEKYTEENYREASLLFEQVFSKELELFYKEEYSLLLEIDKLQENPPFSDMRLMHVLLDIYRKEKNSMTKCSFFENKYSWEEIKDIFSKIKFLERRLYFGKSEETFSDLKSLVKEKGVSKIAISIIFQVAIPDAEKNANLLSAILEKVK